GRYINARSYRQNRSTRRQSRPVAVLGAQIDGYSRRHRSLGRTRAKDYDRGGVRSGFTSAGHAVMTALETVVSALPSRLLTNDYLKATYPDWDFDQLEKAAGVFCRRIASEGETALDFILQACERLSEEGRLRPQEIDAVIFVTQTADYIMPPNSCLL